MWNKKWIKIIISFNIIKLLKKNWYNEKQLCDFISSYWNWNWFKEWNNFIKLYSPTENTIAYKWYFSSLDRTIIFYTRKDKKWVVYPIFFWNKKTVIWKNIKKQVIENYIDELNIKFNKQIKNWEFKIIHL